MGVSKGRREAGLHRMHTKKRAFAGKWEETIDHSGRPLASGKRPSIIAGVHWQDEDFSGFRRDAYEEAGVRWQDEDFS